jgi:plastocyanin
VGLFFFAAVLTALWAVALTILGLRHPGFPGGEGGARIIAAVSCLLAGAGIVTAVITGMEEEHEKEAEARAKEHETPRADPRSIRIDVDSEKELRFGRDRLETTAGTRTLELTNTAALPHNIGVVGQGVDVVGPTVPRGGTSRVTVQLRPGRYTFYCSVLGHREGGMEGTLIVR